MIQKILLNKFIYVHEGKVRESSKRNYLKNKYILASRMTSRPFGWSRVGLENITKLRVNLLNGATRKELADDLRRAE